MKRVLLVTLFLSMACTFAVAEDNVLTEAEKKAGWILLFDGTTTSGWLSIKKEPVPSRHVQAGALNPHPCNYMLIHEKERGDFVLSLDFKISPKCNSGIFFRTSPLVPRPGKDVGFNGLEIAIDDTKGAGFHDTGAIYDLVKPIKNAMKPAGEWNRIVLTCKANMITVQVNGVEVTKINLDNWSEKNKRPDGSGHKFDTAYKVHSRKGYIGLQDHGSDCWFKNIKLKPLDLISSAVPMVVAREEPRFEFTRMIAHWDQYGDADYLEFVREAEPEVVQLGFYGAHFWSLVQTPQFGGYPAHFPVQGWDACGDWFASRNREVHQIDPAIKVIGHFNIELLVGDPDGEAGPSGFFQWYREGWDEAEMGKRPVSDPTTLLERDGLGVPHKAEGYAIGGMHEYKACLRNPGWQQVLKGWVKQGIRRGVDGFMINYFYRGNCLCEHCVGGFKAYLAERFTAAQLQKQFDIGDLNQHNFGEIVSWHDPNESTPLRREMLRFSQISNKAVFDEVFVRYGRTLKPDLLVGQWNHLGDFSQIAGDERCLLPADLWGKDESYLWYSTGGAANVTDLPNRFLGEGTLQARYIRGAFADKPFTLGKYESTRIRVAIAELAANGGAPMGFYTRFKEPAKRAEIVSYYQFLKRYDSLYHGNRPYAEAALLFPRSQVHQGKIEVLAEFKELGRTLLDAHVLFDVVPDDQVEPGRYADTIKSHLPQKDLERILKERRVRVDAPFTVRVSASQPAQSEQEIDLHFVNYNRIEPPKNADGPPSPGSGIIDEKPIPIPIAGVKVEMPELLNARQLQNAVFLTPEIPDGVELAVERSNGRVRFELPEFLVYAVVRLELR